MKEDTVNRLDRAGDTSGPMIGHHFGNYVATAVIGAGGMGTVYLAIHPGIGRQVAIKVLRPELGADESLLARFLNEARAANAIRHPNIIEILDSGVTDSGVSYLVMELLEGEPLVDRLRRLGTLQPPDALELARQIASALGAAHAKKIVHRDLKPDNLFIIPAPDPTNPTRERIKVLDFGIAKLQVAPRPGSLPTQTGMLLGTPTYMSPEQCRGTREVDHRSDIYALGIILFEMLTGRPPFVSEGFGDLVNMHINQAPPIPSTLRPGLPPALDALVLKMLAKNPDDRFASMTEIEPHLIALRGRVTTLRDAGGMAAATAPVAVRGRTTFSHLAEQTQLLPKSADGPAPRRSSRLGGIVGLIVVLGAGGLTASRSRWFSSEPPVASSAAGGGAAKPAVVPAVSVPAGETKKLGDEKTAETPAVPVRLRLASTPPGARIVRVSDGAVLGTTPLLLELRASPTALMLRLEKEGYLPATREIALDRDGEASVVLAPAVVPRPHVRPRPRPPDDEEPAKL